MLVSILLSHKPLTGTARLPAWQLEQTRNETLSSIVLPEKVESSALRRRRHTQHIGFFSKFLLERKYVPAPAGSAASSLSKWILRSWWLLPVEANSVFPLICVVCLRKNLAVARQPCLMLYTIVITRALADASLFSQPVGFFSMYTLRSRRWLHMHFSTARDDARQWSYRPTRHA